MRVLVCGGRNFLGYRKLKHYLEDLLDTMWHEEPQGTFTVIQGGAKGADFLAKVFVEDEWSDFKDVICEEYPADWKKCGKAAGQIRNQQMLDEGKPDLVVAFPGGVGTADMIRRAKKAGIPVEEVG